LSPLTQYFYAIKAFSGTDTSDYSNIDSATTLRIPHIFKRPVLQNALWNLAARTIDVKYYDSSNCELGHKIMISEHFGPFEMKMDIISSDPSFTGDVSTNFSDVKLNTWYEIYVVTHDSAQNELVSQNIARVYTFNAQDMIDKYPRMYLTKKISDFPIRLKGWALKNGDSILMTENNSPDSSYTILDVSDASKPVFKGYRKSIQPIFDFSYIIHAPDMNRYPYPVKYFSKGNNLLCCKNDTILSYLFNGEEFTKVSKLSPAAILGQGLQFRGFYKGFDDSTILILTETIQWDYCREIYASITPLKSGIIGNPINAVDIKSEAAPFSGEHCLSYGCVYINDNKEITTGNNGFVRSEMCITDFSDSYLAPHAIILNGSSPITMERNEDTLNDKVISSASYLNLVQYAGNYLVRDSTLRAINFSFVDTLNKTAYLVFDSLLRIYKYDTMPPAGTIYSRSDNNSCPINKHSFIVSVRQSGQTVSLSLSRPANAGQLRIYTIAGRFIKQQELKNTDFIRTNLLKCNKGVYLFNLSVDGSNQTILVKKY
jgi:hypothetical protein